MSVYKCSLIIINGSKLNVSEKYKHSYIPFKVYMGLLRTIAQTNMNVHISIDHNFIHSDEIPRGQRYIPVVQFDVSNQS